jgi:hypothetical protein
MNIVMTAGDETRTLDLNTMPIRDAMDCERLTSMSWVEWREALAQDRASAVAFAWWIAGKRAALEVGKFSEIDLDLAWAFAPEAEFGFADLARDYFDAIYFRPMQGILFEIATTSPGFAVDEPADRLGESLCLPAQYERLRPALDQRLAPLDARRPRAA